MLKKTCRVIAVLGTLAVVAIFVCNKKVREYAYGKMYTNTVDLPSNKVGLLLGTSKYTSGGRINLYYQYRIEAAVRLFRAGKIKYIVVSGDNGREDYNEPEEMRKDLVRAGIDSSVIYPDYAGFRTFDSIVRLREIFGQTSVTIISQRFHNERALFIASKEHIDAIAFNARDVHAQNRLKMNARELLARVKLFVDYGIHKQPRYLGPKVYIP